MHKGHFIRALFNCTSLKMAEKKVEIRGFFSGTPADEPIETGGSKGSARI